MSTPGRLSAVVWLLGMVLCAWWLSRTPLLADMSAFLPAEPSTEQKLLIANLERGASARLLLASVSGIPPAARRDVSDRLVAVWQALPAVESVANGNMAGFALEQERLLQWRYLLAPSVSAAQFEDADLLASLQRARALLATSAGLFNRDLILADPIGASLQTLSLLEESGGPDRRDGIWVNDDELLFVARILPDGSDLDGQEAAMQAIEDRFAATASESGHADAQLLLSGAPRFAVQSRDEIRGDVIRLSTVGIGLVVALLIGFFRSLRVLLVALIPLGSAVLVGAAAVSGTFGTLHALTLGFGAALIGECVDYALYHLVHASSAPSEGRPGTRSNGFWAPIQLGLATSLVGFGALLWSHFPGLGQLAVFAMAGLTAGFLTTRFVLPVLTANGLPARDFSRLEAWLRQQLLRAGVLRPLALLLTLAAVAVTAVNHDGIWNTDIASLNPVSRDAQALDARMRDALGGPDINTLVLVQPAPDNDASGDLAAVATGANNSPDPNNVADIRARTDAPGLSAPGLDAEQSLLEATALVTVRLREQVSAGNLRAVRSVTDFVPPHSIQRARQAALPDAATLRAGLARLAGESGLPVRSLQTFMTDVENTRTREPLSFADYDDTSLAPLLDGLWTRIDDTPTAILTLTANADAGIDAAALSRAIGKIPGAQVAVLDVKARTDSLYAGYISEALWLASGGALAIALLLAVALRDTGRWLAVITPIVGALALIIAGFVLTGHSLTLLHLVGLLLVAAIGSNYALVLDRDRFRRMSSTGVRDATPVLTPLLLANLTTIAGFGVLAASTIPLLSALGITVGIGAPLVLLLSAIVSAGPDEPGNRVPTASSPTDPPDSSISLST